MKWFSLILAGALILTCDACEQHKTADLSLIGVNQPEASSPEKKQDAGKTDAASPAPKFFQ